MGEVRRIGFSSNGRLCVTWYRVIMCILRRGFLFSFFWVPLRVQEDDGRRCLDWMARNMRKEVKEEGIVALFPRQAFLVASLFS